MSHIEKAVVDCVNPLTDTIVQMQLSPQHYHEYHAGQYLAIHVDAQTLPYSIANAPLGLRHYELHIKHQKDNLLAQRILSTVKDNGILDISVPFGDCHIKTINASLPIIYIAASTGFAPIKAMIESMLTHDDARPLSYYWGAKNVGDIYMSDLVQHWYEHSDGFRRLSCQSGLQQTMLVDDVIAQHKQDLTAWQFVICGSFDMVFGTRDILVEQGVPREHIFSDAFTFE